jgi:hypothetical protein
MSRWRSTSLLVALLFAFAAAAWPEQTEMRKYFDSFYITHPDRGGRKPPTYPLLVQLVTPGPQLVHVQAWSSIACWCFLGFTLARTAGMAILGLLALSPLVRMWNTALLTESLSLSLLALFLALSLLLRRSLEARDNDEDPSSQRAIPWLLSFSWVLAMMAFVMVRSVHLLAIPFAALVFLPAKLPGDRREWQRFVVGACVLAVGLGAGLREAGRSDNGVIAIYTALHEFVFPDGDALARFREAGMPDRRYPMTQPMRRWIEREGKTVYFGWVSSRPSAHVTAWKNLAPDGASGALEERYFSGDRDLGEARWPWVESAGAFVAKATAPPGWLWLSASLLVPIAAWRLGRPLTGLSFAPIALAGMTYAFGFASIWGAGGEALRHGLVASLLYRVTFATAIAAGVAAGRPTRGEAGLTGPSSATPA